MSQPLKTCDRCGKKFLADEVHQDPHEYCLDCYGRDDNKIDLESFTFGLIVGGGLVAIVFTLL